MNITLKVRDMVMKDHLKPFYEKNKLEGETLPNFILRAVTSQAINSKAQEDCGVLKAAMEQEMGRKVNERMKQAEETAKDLFET